MLPYFTFYRGNTKNGEKENPAKYTKESHPESVKIKFWTKNS